ncbi:MAG: hypothetical protein K2O32_08300 [Acetatifactor sp.]|nr:hypothetical protein [Acetatifactor sp.]
MNVFLFLVGMPVIQVLLGSGALGVLYGRRACKMYIADRLIVGFLIQIGLAEVVHLAAVVLGRSFSDVVFLFEAGMVILGFVSLGICLWQRRESGNESRGGRGSGRGRRVGKVGRAGIFSGSDVTPVTAGLFLVFALLVIYQIVTITSGDYIYRAGDMTAETVKSFLETDGVYRVNPLTGRAYEGGIPFRIQILCLPTLYGILCQIFGLPVTELVWKLVPLHVLLMSYLAFGRMAHALLPEEKRRGQVERLLFMVLTAAVLCVGDYLYGMDGFGLLYCGFRGVTIRSVVLLPYVFGLALRHRWRLAALCILAEACIVWTLYGMGACLMVTLGMAALRIWQKRRTEGFDEAGKGA